MFRNVFFFLPPPASLAATESVIKREGKGGHSSDTTLAVDGRPGAKPVFPPKNKINRSTWPLNNDDDGREHFYSTF